MTTAHLHTCQVDHLHLLVSMLVCKSLLNTQFEVVLRK